MHITPGADIDVAVVLFRPLTLMISNGFIVVLIAELNGVSFLEAIFICPTG
jgi:hypothetical protein